MPICVVIFYSASILNILVAFFNIFTWLTLLVLDLALYLSGPFISILMSLLCSISTSGITWGCTYGVYAFFLSILIFGNFSVFGVTIEFLLLIGQKK